MNRILIPTLSLILFGGMAATSVAEEPPLKVFVFAGTSNLSSGTTAELPDDLRKPQNDVLVFQKGEWVPLEAGKVPLRGDGKRFGPEVAFGQTMTKHLGEPIGIIMTTLTAVDDRAGYAQVVKTVEAAQKSRRIVIAGMLIQAGERDGGTEERAKAFPKNLAALIGSARRDFGNKTMPLAINRAIPNPAIAPHVELIRKAEATIDIPGFRVVDCDDVPRGGDKVHYTTKGQLEFGKRFADAMIELLKVDKGGKSQPKPGAPVELEALTFTDPNDAKKTLPYRFLAPSKIEKDKRYPLLLCLHSLGLVGDDNKKQLNDFQDLFVGLKRGPYQCFVLVPQAPTGQDKKWNTYGPYGDGLMKKDPTSTMALVKALVDESLTKYPVDPQRIYVTGPSMGGYGTWEFVQRWPEMVAAAAPVCGGGDVTHAQKVKDVPLWVFHGAKDRAIKPEYSIKMVEAIQAAGGKPGFTLYPDVDHPAWLHAYSDPMLLRWMFAQRKPDATPKEKP